MNVEWLTFMRDRKLFLIPDYDTRLPEDNISSGRSRTLYQNKAFLKWLFEKSCVVLTRVRLKFTRDKA